MTIKIQLVLQRPANLTGQRSNILLLDALLKPLDDAGTVPLSLDLSNASTVALVLEFSRSWDAMSDGEPMVDEGDASEWVVSLLYGSLSTWKVLKGETLRFEPDTEPDEAEARANHGLGSRPFS